MGYGVMGRAMVDDQRFTVRRLGAMPLALAGALVPGCIGFTACFEETQPVDTPVGPVPIGLLRPGSPILAFDEASGLPVASRVVATRHVRGQPLGAVDTDDGARLLATEHHPIFRPDRGDYLPARTWRGEGPVLRGGRVRRARFAELQRRGTVVDLTVAGTHNFLVDGVVVHNKSLADDCSALEQAVSCHVTTSVNASEPGPAVTAPGIDPRLVSTFVADAGGSIVGAAGAAGAAGASTSGGLPQQARVYVVDYRPPGAQEPLVYGGDLRFRVLDASGEVLLRIGHSAVGGTDECRVVPLGSVRLPGVGDYQLSLPDVSAGPYRLELVGARATDFRREPRDRAVPEVRCSCEHAYGDDLPDRPEYTADGWSECTLGRP